LNGRYEATVPPVVKWADIVSTIALVSLVHQADDLLSAPGALLGALHVNAIKTIEADCRAALVAYRASAAVFS
jgi:hypothetical protein